MAAQKLKNSSGRSVLHFWMPTITTGATITLTILIINLNDKTVKCHSSKTTKHIYIKWKANES